MKPTTKYEIYLSELSLALKKVDVKNIQLAKEKLFKTKQGIVYKRGILCGECGNRDNLNMQNSKLLVLNYSCPACNQKLKLKDSNSMSYNHSEYFGFSERIQDHQVVRIFMLSKYYSKTEKHHFGYKEVMQHFISPKGEIRSFSIGRNPWSHYYDAWISGSKMELKDRSFAHTQNFYTFPSLFLPIRSKIESLKRNGLKTSTRNIIPHILMSNILKNPIAETLLKLGEQNLLKYYCATEVNVRSIEKHWGSLKAWLYYFKKRNFKLFRLFRFVGIVWKRHQINKIYLSRKSTFGTSKICF